MNRNLKLLTQKDLLQMLTYRRPADSRTEEEFIARYIDPVHAEMYQDQFGNRILRTDGGIGKAIIACHTDTVHHWAGRQKIQVTGGIAHLPIGTASNCLGADDTAGVYAALRMIQAGVKATFIFHRSEEIGGIGGQWLADRYPEWLRTFDVCLSLDRRGTQDIITHQFGTRTASDLFAYELADALDMLHTPAIGIFTDSANYAHLIPECSNVSVGYQHEHSKAETLNLGYLEALIARLCKVDWQALVDVAVARDIDGDWGATGDELDDELDIEFEYAEDTLNRDRDRNLDFYTESDRQWCKRIF